VKRLFVFVLTAATVFSTVTCTVFRDPLAKFINDKFPPVTIDQQRQEAIASTAGALASVTAPNVTFGAPIADLEKTLNTEELQKLGITSIRLRGEDELLRVEGEFTRRFTDAGPDASPEVQALLQRLTPEVQGKAVIYAGITSAVAVNAANGSELRLKLLPVFRSITVDKVVLAGEADVTMIGDLLARLVNAYADNITGELSRSKFVDIVVPAAFGGTVDASRAIRVSTEDGNANVTIDAQPVGAPVRLLGVASLITDERISAVAQFVPAGSANPQPGTPVPATYAEVKKAFDEAVNRSFELPDEPNGPWFAIRKDLVATIVNSALSQASVCVSVRGETQQKLSQEIRFPDESTVDCTPTRPRDFEPCHDTRNCDVCLIPNPFGGCIQRGNDPFCEAAKAAENARCQVEAAGKKFDCERIKSQEKLLCETGKEALKRLARTGKFGNLEAGVHARTDDLRVCMKSFTLAPDLTGVRTELDIQGAAMADVSMKFTPLDIVGHLACQAPFTEQRSFEAALRKSEVTIESGIQLANNADGATATFEVQENTVPVRIQPGPTEFLLTSPNLTLACQGLNLVKPLTVVLLPFIPELRGEFDQKIKKKEVAVDLAIPTQHVGDLTIHGSVQNNAKAIFLFSDIKTATKEGGVERTARLDR
jgi:hypothetical protein